MENTISIIILILCGCVVGLGVPIAREIIEMAKEHKEFNKTNNNGK